MDFSKINIDNPVIAWWSGGVTSAVTCKLCIDWFGLDSVRIIFEDTHNEDSDTYRFKDECQVWYGKEIETIDNPDYSCIKEIWYESLSLNFATGARCSQMLKRVPRERFEKQNNYSYQAFGFDIKEINRALGMKLNNPSARPIFPLINELLSKKDSIKYVEKANSIFHPLRLPNCYYRGLHNNNCYDTGCVQGGIGYWQWFDKFEPWKVDIMGKIEHELTDLKGEPVTILKDQSKNGGLVFLRHNPKYPLIKDLSMMKGRPVLPLIECNGFCGMDDIQPNKSINELNLAM